MSIDAAFTALKASCARKYLVVDAGWSAGVAVIEVRRDPLFGLRINVLALWCIVEKSLKEDDR